MRRLCLDSNYHRAPTRSVIVAEVRLAREASPDAAGSMPVRASGWSPRQCAKPFDDLLECRAPLGRRKDQLERIAVVTRSLTALSAPQLGLRKVKHLVGPAAHHRLPLAIPVAILGGTASSPTVHYGIDE